MSKLTMLEDHAKASTLVGKRQCVTVWVGTKRKSVVYVETLSGPIRLRMRARGLGMSGFSDCRVVSTSEVDRRLEGEDKF